MQYFFSQSTNGFYIKPFNEQIPKDAIELSKLEYEDVLVKQGKGYKLSTKNGSLVTEQYDQSENYQALERKWRNSELTYCDIEIYKLQDSDSTARSSITEWRTYRKLLRRWPEHPNFPDTNFRPTPPDA